MRRTAWISQDSDHLPAFVMALGGASPHDPRNRGGFRLTPWPERTRRPLRRHAAILGLTLALGAAPRVVAQDTPRRAPFVELHLGIQSPDSDEDRAMVPEAGGGVSLRELDRPDWVIGARAGHAWKRLSLSGLVTHYETERGRGRLERTSLAAEAGWIAVTRGRGSLIVHGGVGVLRARATDAQEWESRSLGMIQAGIGLRLDLGRRIYLRPELRAHAYGGSQDNPDWEATLGIGCRLGSRLEDLKEPSR